MGLLQETGCRAERMGAKKSREKNQVEKEKKDKDDRKANDLFPPTGQIPNVGVSTQKLVAGWMDAGLKKMLTPGQSGAMKSG